MAYTLTKVTSLKSVADFRKHVQGLGLDIAIDDEVSATASSALLQPATWNGQQIGNRIAIQPMEGWDATTTGAPTEPMIRRWSRFGQSGAKLIWGGEAMAVRPDGRANPNQLMLLPENEAGIAKLREQLVDQHREHYQQTDDLVIGFQLTHSGRFCRPNDKKRWEPRVAYRHPILDPKFSVTNDSMVWTDAQLDDLIGDYARSAVLAQRIGAQFVDIKSCHGYLLHEFLGAKTRSGRYGGSFENRTRLLFSIIRAVQQAAPGLGIGVRLSAYDTVPFVPDPTTAAPGKQGQGMPSDYQKYLPYVWGFGINEQNPLEHDLTEVRMLIQQLGELGVSLINLSAGSPYYTPHILRPAAYPPSDGYQPHEDPLISVARHLNVTRELKQQFPNILLVGSGYSYLQEFLPNVAAHQVRMGFVDFIGMGRMVLSYPQQLMDAIHAGKSERKLVCRTFSDCTTAPRNGLASGCYPLDEYYKKSPDADRLKEIKANIG
jgi:2,4-dienoyl-CoA reductase-like NADH-dependent reductase (Old Yellow Enzyme family)